MSRPPRDVVLVHGLWVPRLAMTPLGVRLARMGWRCHTFGYAGRAHRLAAHAERLLRFAHERFPRGAHFVGHSLGGLVVLDALLREPDCAVASVVLLGTPVRGCLAGRRLERYGWGRWILGESRQLWSEGRSMRWTRGEPLGVIAGTLAVSLGRAFGALPGPNDAVVRVEETTVEGMRERISLPVSHSTMLVSSRVARAVSCFLERGTFDGHAS